MSALTSLLDKAPILHRTEDEICFHVDDVEPCTKQLPVMDIKSKVEAALKVPLLASSHEAWSNVVSANEAGDHGLVNAVHLAFSEHRPLVLTPDAIWLTLAQGFAQHVNNHAEALRSRFVSHKDQMVLKVEVKEVTSAEHWSSAIQQWSTQIGERVEAALYELMICNFSTTTPVVKTASQVAMMDAFQQYFEYQLMCICGIPSVTLKGTLADWVKIRERVDVMEAYHLEWWTDRLKLVCDALVETAKGTPSRTFWRHIYKPKEVYGGEVMTGWLADLFPYINDDRTKTPTVRNPILATPREKLTVEDGLSPESVPTGLSQAPFKLSFLPTQQTYELELIAGFIGVQENETAGQLEPQIGWAVCNNRSRESTVEKD
jgi:hypothetical protein